MAVTLSSWERRWLRLISYPFQSRLFGSLGHADIYTYVVTLNIKLLNFQLEEKLPSHVWGGHPISSLTLRLL